MKKNKLLIYIALLFCLFMIGITKVKASTYLACRYEIEKSVLSQYGSAPAIGNLEYNQYIYLYYKDGNLYERYGAISPFKVKGNAHNYQIFDYKTSTALKEDDFIIGDDGTTTKCPSLKVKKYYYIPTTSEVGDPIAETEYIDNSGKTSFEAKLVSSKVAKLATNSCNYTLESNKKTINVDYSSHNVFWFFLDGGGFKKWEGIKVNNNIPKSTEWFYDRTNSHSQPQLLWKFLEDGSECPTHLYYKDDKNIKFSPDSTSIKGYARYDLACNYDTELNEYKKFIENNYDTKNKKVTATLNKEFGEKVAKMNSNFGNFLESNNISEGSSQYKVCKMADIKKELGEITIACSKDNNCNNSEITKDAKNYMKWKKGLEAITPIGYEGVIDCSIFGDENKEGSLLNIIKQIFTWIRIAVPILLIVLGIMDFTKVVVSQDPDAMKKSTSKFAKRCVMALIIFFIPSIVIMILKWIDQYIMSTDPDCVIGSLNIIINNINNFIK